MEVSIVVPTHGRPEHLRACLKWVARLEFPRSDFEVVVVDDGSPEAMDSVVGPFGKRLNLTLVRKDNGGPASARNLGAEAARGCYLAFLDDDCRPAKKWLRTIAQSLSRHPQDMVGGHTVNRLSRNPYSTASQFLVDIVYKHFNSAESPNGFFTSNNLALNAELFRHVGGFDSRFALAAAEDREFCERWLALGYRLRYVPESVIYHLHRLNFGSFMKQHLNYGRGASLYHAIRSQRGHRSLKVDLEFHGQLIKHLRVPVPGGSFGQQSRVAAALVLSQLSYIAGYAQARLFGESRSIEPDAASQDCSVEVVKSVGRKA